MKERIERVINEMSAELTVRQLRGLQSVLIRNFAENIKKCDGCDNAECLSDFLSAKGVEGCSSRTIKYYQVAIEHMSYTLNRPVREITTEDLRDYLVRYQKINNCSKVTVDNIRRKLSSFICETFGNILLKYEQVSLFDL